VIFFSIFIETTPMKHFFYPIVAMCAVLCVSSCKQSNYSTPVGNGQAKIVFSNNVGNTYLVLGNSYVNQHGDNFTVNTLKYYISNVKLTGAEVSYTEPNSYHLIDQNNMTNATFYLSNMQYGQYNSITFTIGIDSLHDVVGPQTGALDPANNMFINFSAGYNMLKFEGTSAQSTQPGGLLKLYAQGYYGANSALRTVSVAFPNPINISGDVTNINHVNVVADVLGMFKAPHVIDFSSMNLVTTPGANVSLLADDYANMFSVSSGM
jgi:hypothetical protein